MCSSIWVHHNVLLDLPESAVVGRIDVHRGVVAPARAGAVTPNGPLGVALPSVFHRQPQPSLPEEIRNKEPHVGRALGQAADVRGVPLAAVGGVDAHWVAVGGGLDLRPTAGE